MRRRLRCLPLLPVLVATACGGGQAEGNALGRGAPVAGVVKYPATHPRIGTVWDLSFPFLANRSDQPVTVTGFTIAHVPTGVKVLRYRVLNSHETHGLLDVARPGDSDPRVDVDRFRNYLGRRLVIAPGAVSSFYAMVEVKLTSKVHDDLDGCIVHYRTGGKTYDQTLACDYRFQPPPQPGHR